MTVVSFDAAYRQKHGTPPTVQLSKRRLAQALHKSPRWVELRVREGMPA